MTLQELITDLKAAGANDNTMQLAMNCYELGQRDEREACEAALREAMKRSYEIAAATIRARGNK